MSTAETKKEKKPTKYKVTIIILIIIIILLLGMLPVVFVMTNSQNTDLITLLNRALARQAQKENNQVNVTLQDAIDDLKAEGYVLEDLYEREEKDILWNQDKNEFVYNNNYAGINYWKIQNNYDEANQVYSIYAGKNFPLTEVNNLKVGFDAGEHTNITSVTYNRKDLPKQTAYVRTNGGTFTVDAPYDTVRHYGKANRIDIKETATQSYHEHGEVVLINVNKGRVVFEKNSDVAGTHFTRKDKDTFDQIIIAYDEGVTLPTFSRDKVENIAEEGTLVVEIQHGVEEQEAKSDYVYLFQEGIFQQIIVKNEEGQKFADEPEVNNVTSHKAEEIANAFNGDVAPVWAEDDTTRKLEDIVNKEEALNVPEDATPEEIAQAIEEKVDTEAKTSEEAQEEAEVKFNVKAYVTPIDNPTDIEADVLYNTQYTTLANMQIADTYNAFSPEDDALTEAFYNAKKDGKNIFSNHIEDFSDNAKVEAAIAVIASERGQEAASRIRELLEVRSPYLSYRVDYEISFDRAIKAGSVILAGYYKSFSENFADGRWIGFGISAVGENKEISDLPAYQTVRLLDTCYNYTGKEDFHMNYAAICGYVKEFKCGIANYDAANTGTKVTLKLVIYELDENGNETGVKNVCATKVVSLRAPDQAN